MSILLKFIQDFLGQFFVNGFWGTIKGIGLGIANIFNIPKYIEIFKKYDIWLAQWSEKPTFERTYGMWQKTSKGKVNGIEGNVDLDESYKNYPAIMKYNGLNGFGAPIEAKPPKRGFTAGQKVVLKNAKLYSSAWSDVVKNHLSGTYYIYDGIYFEGRYRVTNSLSKTASKSSKRVPV